MDLDMLLRGLCYNSVIDMPSLFYMNLWVVLIMGVCCFCSSVRAAEAPVMPLTLTFDEALKRADKLSLSMILAEARVQESIARMAQARSQLLPQVSGTAQMNRQTQDLRATGIQIPGLDPHVGPFNAFDARARVAQVIFDAGAFDRLRAAIQGRDLSKAQKRKAKEDVLALVAALYVEALRAEEHRTWTRYFLARDRKAYQLAQARFTAGTGSKIDLDKARADYAQSRFVYHSAKREAVQTKLDIQAALNIPSDSAVHFERATLNAVLSEMPGRSMEMTPAMRVAEGQIRFQEAQLAAARAGYWPVITGIADYGRSGRTMDQSSNTYLIGLKATVPIWEGGNRQAVVAQEQAKLTEAKAQWDDTALREDVNVIVARERIQEAEAFLAAQREALALSTAQLMVAKERLQSGLGHPLDVFTAQAQLARAKDEEGAAEAQLWLAKIGLMHAAGRMPALIEH